MKKIISPLLVLLSVAAFCFGYFILDEIVIAVSNPSEYHFGAESMIAEGGNHYKSLSAYVKHGHLISIASFFVSLCCGIAGVWLKVKGK